MDRHSLRAIGGFSIIELVVVISIIGIVAVFANFSWPGTALNLGAQSEQLATDLRYTQTLSMTQGQRFCLKLTTSSYQIINSGTSTAVILALGNTSVTFGSGISMIAIVPANTVLIVFDGQGMPYYSTSTTCNSTNAQGATALSSNAAITLTANGQSRIISISPTTGRVLIQ